MLCVRFSIKSAMILERSAIAAMKFKEPAISETYRTVKLLKSREKELSEFVSFVQKHINAPRSIVVTGMRRIGKTVKAQELVKRLKEQDIPAIYINIGTSENCFVSNAAYSLDINDAFASDLSYNDIYKALTNACDHFEKSNTPNVIVFDEVSNNSPYFKALSRAACFLSQKYPSTMVVLVTCDSTDTLLMPPGQCYPILFWCQFLVIYHI